MKVVRVDEDGPLQVDDGLVFYYCRDELVEIGDVIELTEDQDTDDRPEPTNVIDQLLIDEFTRRLKDADE